MTNRFLVLVPFLLAQALAAGFGDQQLGNGQLLTSPYRPSSPALGGWNYFQQKPSTDLLFSNNDHTTNQTHLVECPKCNFSRFIPNFLRIIGEIFMIPWKITELLREICVYLYENFVYRILNNLPITFNINTFLELLEKLQAKLEIKLDLPDLKYFRLIRPGTFLYKWTEYLRKVFNLPLKQLLEILGINIPPDHLKFLLYIARNLIQLKLRIVQVLLSLISGKPFVNIIKEVLPILDIFQIPSSLRELLIWIQHQINDPNGPFIVPPRKVPTELPYEVIWELIINLQQNDNNDNYRNKNFNVVRWILERGGTEDDINKLIFWIISRANQNGCVWLPTPNNELQPPVGPIDWSSQNQNGQPIFGPIDWQPPNQNGQPIFGPIISDWPPQNQNGQPIFGPLDWPPKNQNDQPIFGPIDWPPQNQNGQPIFGALDWPPKNQNDQPIFGPLDWPPKNQNDQPIFGSIDWPPQNQNGQPIFGPLDRPPANQNGQPIAGPLDWPPKNQNDQPIFGPIDWPPQNQNGQPIFGPLDWPPQNQNSQPIFGPLDWPPKNQNDQPIFGPIDWPPRNQNGQPLDDSRNELFVGQPGTVSGQPTIGPFDWIFKTRPSSFAPTVGPVADSNNNEPIIGPFIWPPKNQHDQPTFGPDWLPNAQRPLRPIDWTPNTQDTAQPSFGPINQTRKQPLKTNSQYIWPLPSTETIVEKPKPSWIDRIKSHFPSGSVKLPAKGAISVYKGLVFGSDEPRSKTPAIGNTGPASGLSDLIGKDLQNCAILQQVFEFFKGLSPSNFPEQIVRKIVDLALPGQLPKNIDVMKLLSFAVRHPAKFRKPVVNFFSEKLGINNADQLIKKYIFTPLKTLGFNKPEDVTRWIKKNVNWAPNEWWNKLTGGKEGNKRYTVINPANPFQYIKSNEATWYPKTAQSGPASGLQPFRVSKPNSYFDTIRYNYPLEIKQVDNNCNNDQQRQVPYNSEFFKIIFPFNSKI